MASSSCRVLRWVPRRICFWVSSANHRSTRLIQEALVGVKCNWKRGLLANQRQSGTDKPQIADCDVTALRLECEGCRRSFFVHRRCFRGQAYCGNSCRTQKRLDSIRRARRRHRNSLEGRADHRDAERDRRLRRRVADHSSANRRRPALLPRGATCLPTPAEDDWQFRCALCRGRLDVEPGPRTRGPAGHRRPGGAPRRPRMAALRSIPR
jgi:hypothetical protein